MLEGVLTVILGVVATVLAGLILAPVISSRWRRKRRIARIVKEIHRGRPWADQQLREVMQPTHEDYPLLQELQKEEFQRLVAGRWHKPWLRLWAWIRGIA